MPPRKTDNRPIAYVALPSRKQQTTFPDRRRSVKPSPALPKLNKDQSTLTQIGFGTPSAPSEIISISSDEEFEEPRPKKKRKRSGKFDERKADQSTMTQFQRGEFPRSTSKAQEIKLDEDGFQIWEDSDFERDMAKERAKATSGLNDDEDDENDQIEIPETSQPYVPSSQEMERCVETKTEGTGVTYQTPRKARFTEVPSSQTPPSTKLSTQKSIPAEPIQRSPLVEKSVNVQNVGPSQQSPESQNVAMKMLEKVRFATRRIPLNDTTSRPAPPEDHADDCRPVPFAALDHHPKLERATTIQDSESDNLDPAGILDSESVGKRPRKLSRVATVQDSQIDDLDLEDPTHINENGDENFEESQFYDYDANDPIFDPANSALDRDAARFRWTQTQTQPRLDRIEEGNDSETDDDDLDGHYSHKTTHPKIPAPSKPLRDIAELSEKPQPSTEEPEAKQLQTTNNATAKHPTVHEDTAYESEDVAPQVIEVPSSPPVPRPSQVSTVVPTQMSPQRPSSQIDVQHPASQAPTVSSPTQKLSSYPMPEPFSDSPLELPPWSSPERAKWANREQGSDPVNVRSGGHLESLVDFSLPPPPPLPSSRRQTPASSLS